MKKLRWADDDTERWIVESWEAGVRKAIARELRRIQRGEPPLAFRKLTGFGPQVAELKRGALRVVYTTELPEEIGIACAFRKDAKRGDSMRPEHEKQIKRGLVKLRAGQGIEETKWFH